MSPSYRRIKLDRRTYYLRAALWWALVKGVKGIQSECRDAEDGGAELEDLSVWLPTMVEEYLGEEWEKMRMVTMTTAARKINSLLDQPEPSPRGPARWGRWRDLCWFWFAILLLLLTADCLPQLSSSASSGCPFFFLFLGSGILKIFFFWFKNSKFGVERS